MKPTRAITLEPSDRHLIGSKSSFDTYGYVASSCVIDGRVRILILRGTAIRSSFHAGADRDIEVSRSMYIL